MQISTTSFFHAFCTLIPHIVVGWRHWLYHQCGSAVVLSPRPQRRPPDYTAGANTHALSVPTNNIISLSHCTLEKSPSSTAMGLEYHQSGPGGREGSVVLASALHWFPPRTAPNHPHYIHCPNATTGHCWTVNLVTRRCLFGGRVIICFFRPAPPGHGRAQEAEFGKCERSVTARWRDHPTLIPLLSHPSMPTCTPTPA